AGGVPAVSRSAGAERHVRRRAIRPTAVLRRFLLGGPRLPGREGPLRRLAPFRGPFRAPALRRFSVQARPDRTRGQPAARDCAGRISGPHGPAGGPVAHSLLAAGGQGRTQWRAERVLIGTRSLRVLL